jgi:hypothetical protein
MGFPIAQGSESMWPQGLCCRRLDEALYECIIIIIGLTSDLYLPIVGKRTTGAEYPLEIAIFIK